MLDKNFFPKKKKITQGLFPFLSREYKTGIKKAKSLNIFDYTYTVNERTILFYSRVGVLAYVIDRR